MIGDDERPYGYVSNPTVPPKDAPPGYAIRFNRWSRQWSWRADGCEIACVGFPSREDANGDAYEDLRRRRAQYTTGAA